MNDVKSFEQTVQCANSCKGVTYKCNHISDILNYVLCELSHAWDLVQFFALALYLN